MQKTSAAWLGPGALDSHTDTRMGSLEDLGGGGKEGAAGRKGRAIFCLPEPVHRGRRGENKKTRCLRGIFIKKLKKTLSNGLLEGTSSAGEQPMISENYIITLCLLIFFSPYLIIICSSICLFKDM